MNQLAIDAVTTGGVSMEFVLNFLGILGAVVSMIMLFGTKSQLGVRVEEGLNLIIFGIFFNAVALVWDTIMMYTKGMPTYIEDIHPVFIIIGMIFFVVAARKFSFSSRSE